MTGVSSGMLHKRTTRFYWQNKKKKKNDAVAITMKYQQDVVFEVEISLETRLVKQCIL